MPVSCHVIMRSSMASLRLPVRPLPLVCLHLVGVALSGAEPPLPGGSVVVEAGVVIDERPRDGDGSFDGDWQLFETRLFLRPHEAVRVGVGLGASRDAYHAEGVGQELPDEVRHAWLRVPVAVMVHQNWGMTVQASFGTGTDGEASTSAGRQWQVQGGPLYVRDDDLIIALLVNVSSRIDDDPSIFVFPSLYWRFHPDWRLTVVDEVDNLSHLRWGLRDDLDLGLRVDVRFREAALADDLAFSDDHVAVAFQATWMPAGRGRFEITPVIGVQVVRRLAVRDDDGNEQWSFLTRPAPLAGLNLRAKF